MKHSKVVPLAILKKSAFSIIQIARLIITFYKSLSEENLNYNHIYIISEKKPLFQNIDIQQSDSVQKLAEEILHRNIDDIRKIDKISDPDVNYCRDGRGGINISLQTKIKDDTLITLNYSFYQNRSAIGSIVVNELCFDTFLKTKKFLEAANKTFPVDYSVMKISDLLLNKISRDYVAPLGWITYFSESYDDLIPDDLQGVRYERTDIGKYLILSLEDIPKDAEKLEVVKKELIQLMGQIEKESPTYSKKNNRSSI